MEIGTVISKDSTNFLLLFLPHEAFGKILIGLNIYKSKDTDSTLAMRVMLVGFQILDIIWIFAITWLVDNYRFAY